MLTTRLATITLVMIALQAQPGGDLKEGDTAPDFTLQDVAGKKTVKLSELRGKPVVLIFGSCT
jgi:hypothetical protein